MPLTKPRLFPKAGFFLVRAGTRRGKFSLPLVLRPSPPALLASPEYRAGAPGFLTYRVALARTAAPTIPSPANSIIQACGSGTGAATSVDSIQGI